MQHKTHRYPQLWDQRSTIKLLTVKMTAVCHCHDTVSTSEWDLRMKLWDCLFLHQRYRTYMTWLGQKYLLFSLPVLLTIEKTGLHTHTHTHTHTSVHLLRSFFLFSFSFPSTQTNTRMWTWTHAHSGSDNLPFSSLLEIKVLSRTIRVLQLVTTYKFFLVPVGTF